MQDYQILIPDWCEQVYGSKETLGCPVTKQKFPIYPSKEWHWKEKCDDYSSHPKCSVISLKIPHVLVLENRIKDSSIMEDPEAAHSHSLSDEQRWREAGEHSSILPHVETEPVPRLTGFGTAEITPTLPPLYSSHPYPKGKSLFHRVTFTKLLCLQNKYHPWLCVYKVMSQIFEWPRDANSSAHWTNRCKSTSLKHPECSTTDI